MGNQIFSYLSYNFAFKSVDLYISRDMNRKFEYKLTKTYNHIVRFMSTPEKFIPKSDQDPAMEWLNYAGSEHLTHLIQFTFKDFLKSHHKVLVLFFDPSNSINFLTK